jgi:hypothetical protein
MPAPPESDIPLRRGSTLSCDNARPLSCPSIDHRLLKVAASQLAMDAAGARGLLPDIGTLHLDRGYDNGVTRGQCAERGLTDLVIAEKRTKGSARGKPKRLPPGLRWPVERTNSWLSNYGQLRRNTDRRIIHIHRLAQLALAIAFILTVKLFAWADRWNH